MPSISDRFLNGVNLIRSYFSSRSSGSVDGDSQEGEDDNDTHSQGDLEVRGERELQEEDDNHDDSLDAPSLTTRERQEEDDNHDDFLDAPSLTTKELDQRRQQEESDIKKAVRCLKTIHQYTQKLKLEELTAIPIDGPVLSERLRAKSLTMDSYEALSQQCRTFIDQLKKYQNELAKMIEYFREADLPKSLKLVEKLTSEKSLLQDNLNTIQTKLIAFNRVLSSLPNQSYIYQANGLSCRKIGENLPDAKSKAPNSGIARLPAEKGSVSAALGDEFYYDVDRNGVSACFKLSYQPIGGEPAPVAVRHGEAHYIPPCRVEVVTPPYVKEGGKNKSAPDDEQVKFYLDAVFAFLVANGGHPITKDDPITVYGKEAPYLWTALMVVGKSFGISEDAIKVQGFDPKDQRGLTGYRSNSVYKELFEPNLSTVKDKVNEFKSIHQTLSQNSAALDTVVTRTNIFKEEISKVKPDPTPSPGSPTPTSEEQQPWMRTSP